MPRFRSRLAAGSVAAVLAFVPAACGDDEDDDGAVTDEEVNELEETGEDVGNELEEEVGEGQGETEDDE